MAVKRVFNIGPMEGDLDRWVATLSSWAVDIGVDAFVYWHPDRPFLERFVAEIVPAVQAEPSVGHFPLHHPVSRLGA